MPTTIPKCAKCAGEMQTGFLVDHGHANAPKVSTWIEGYPEASVWGGLKLNDRANLMCVTFRCMACGYLESYAIDRPRV